MSAGARRLSVRATLLVLLAGPLAAALAAAWLTFAPGRGAVGPEELERRERRIGERFEGLLEQAAETAALALRVSPAAALTDPGPVPLGARLEGAGVLGPDLEFVDWEGVPAEPPADFDDPRSPAWRVLVEGARTRLLARAGPDGAGRLGLACFVIDSNLDDLSFRDLLPAPLLRGLQVEVRFVGDDRGLYVGGGGGSARARLATLAAPDGEVLGMALLEPIAADWMRAHRLAAARAWAIALALVALAGVLRWGRLATSGRGLGVGLATLAAGRALLLWQQVPARILPRELGSPTLYGSTAAWGLFSSPADLVLTALGVYLALRAVGAWCLAAGLRRRALGAATAALAGTAASACAAAVALSIARNTRLPLLGRPAPFEWDGRLALWLALLLLLLAAAESWGAGLALLRAPRAAGATTAPFPARVTVALVLVALIVPAGLLLEHETQRLDLEHLSHDYAPQVLEQDSYRRVTLVAALREIAEDDRVVDKLAHHRAETSTYDAYDTWVSGELFHARLQSSIDVYGADGEHWSHFGFGLPPLEEDVTAAALDDGIEIREEAFQVGIAEERRLLHAEVALAVGDEIVAVVVGHVLDEPDNLPFLPWNRPYLAALGPGGALGGAALAGGPDYVLYDAEDDVALTTLRQPPAAREVRRRAGGGDSLRLSLGEASYLGLALPDGELLHLLLAPRRSGIEQLATAVRLALLGLALLALLTLVVRLLRPGLAGQVVIALRGTFYRKLVTAVLLAAVPPLLGLALFLGGYIEGRAGTELAAAARQYVGAARQVVEDFSAQADPEDPEAEAGPDDVLLHWLRSVVGQEIHVYRHGLLQASSKRELFSSGLLPPRLDGRVQRRLVEEGLPSVILSSRLGPITMPVAYAPVRPEGSAVDELVVAVPLVVEQKEIADEAARVAEMLLLATVALVGLLAVAAALLARTVARPVRRLVEATARIASGRYSTRLEPRGRDEVGELFRGFNSMASALAQQRADLERRRDYIETLLAHATTGVVSLDPAGRIVTLNPAARRLLEAEAAPLEIGAALADVLEGSPQLRPLSVALAPAERRRTGEPVDVDLLGEPAPRRIRLVRVDLRGASGDSVGTMILLDDVTDLMRSNQLAAWAEMARAIAHEIKNPLTPIQLSTEHLGRLLRDRDAPPTPEELACLETIMKQVRALYEIAGEFSTYSRLPDLAPEPTDPVAFMRSVAGPYRAARPAGVTIEESYEPAARVRIDPKVLSRAVVNLIENALQAMERGGTLTLAVRNGGPDRAVELRVSDTGPGLAPHVRQRLFEPYFSTKSSGTGLGLAIVRRAVEAHRGEILVDSPPQGGTTFRIRLPPLSDP